MYVADERGNVLAINFWDNLNDLVLENVVSLGSTLYIKNLQWRGFNKKARIQEGYHANFTEYIANPSGPEMEKFLMALTQPGNKDIYINCSLQIKVSLNFHS